MSLIFEALKKLDREKQAPDRGFLVVGASAWGAGRRLRPLPIVVALAGAGVAGYLVAQWASRPKAEPPVAVAATAPPPSVAAPRTVPPPTYAAPSPSTYEPTAARAPVPDAARQPSAPAVQPRPAPAQAEPAAARPARVAAAPTEVPAPAVETTYTLQAVTAQDGQPVAIVNGQLVRVGDVIEGARVLRIDADAVELEKDGRRIVVSF